MNLTTDHFPILSYIPTATSESQISPVIYRKLKEIDLESFKVDLHNAIDSIEAEGKSFAELNTTYNKIASSIVDKHAPKVSMKRKQGEPVWLDREYKKNSTLRRK